MKYILFIFLLLVTFPAPSNAANTPSLLSAQHVQEPDELEEGFEPGLFLFLVMGAIIVLLGVGAGIAITVVALLAVLGLISAGILSASVVAGLYKKSFSHGFKVLLVLSCTAAGAIGFAAIGWLVAALLDWDYATTISTGAVSGLFSGLAFGFVAWYVFRLLLKQFKSFLKLEAPVTNFPK